MRNIPNCMLYSGEDIYHNSIQALVPFGEDPVQVFEALFVDDWDSAVRPQKVVEVFASTIQALFSSRSRGLTVIQNNL